MCRPWLCSARGPFTFTSNVNVTDTISGIYLSPGGFTLNVNQGLDLTGASVTTANAISTNGGTVTGATGGVGSFAVAILKTLGYTVAASTGRPEESDYLKALGATEIVDRAQLSAPSKPLGKERWAGQIAAAAW